MQNNPLLKKKGIPECILTVTQRITKYPLLIEAIIKTSENKTEVEKLRKATELVKVSENNECFNSVTEQSIIRSLKSICFIPV